MVYLDATCISYYAFSERLKFEAFKTKKIAMKSLNVDIYRPSENEEFEAFERVIILLLYTFFENVFSNKWFTLLSNKNLSKNVFNDILDEKWPTMLILEIFSSQLQDMNRQKVYDDLLS